MIRSTVHADGVVLCDRFDGSWRITTSAGTVYVLDLDHQVVRRLPGAVDQVLMPLVAMRRDAELIELVQLRPVKIGRSMKMVVTGAAE
jgi:hypothetical protein